MVPGHAGSARRDDTVSAHIDHLWGAGPPQYNLTVYAPETPVPVHFIFVCDTNGSHAGSVSEIPSLLAGVNYIYRQAGVRFEQASVTYTNNQEWYQYSYSNLVQAAIVDSRTGTDGLEVYIVPNIAPNVLGRNWANRGLLITDTHSASDIHIVAHEFGHECGWSDIYTSAPGQPQMTTLLSPDHLSPSDWNNGPGPQEYYLRGLPLATVIRRCLMFGYTIGSNDIPAGSVRGYDKYGVLGLVPVGAQGMSREPKHSD